jgi:transcriptional regulator with XRE-family HTH domain
MILNHTITQRKRVTPETKIIGANARNFRKKAGFSQAEVGKRLGVAFQQIQKYEAGKNRLPAEKLYILKHLYNVPYEYFFVGLEHMLTRKGG